MQRWKQRKLDDAPQKVRCPECRTMMERREKRGGINFDHFICRRCDWTWLDAGELELFQLGYLVSEKGQEAQRLKDLHEQMTPEEKELLQKAIDNLPDDLGGWDPDFKTDGL